MMMPADVDESWARVTAWLAANAPVTHSMLRPPATDLDPRLPAELRRLLLITDGADDSDLSGACLLPGMHRPQSADQIADDNAMHLEILDDLGDDYDEMVGRWWHPQWIAFASSGAGTLLVIDDRPGPEQGTVWHWDRVDGLLWEFGPSLGEFLADVASALENGTPLHGWRAEVENGDLDWVPV
jgi:cell wall assembly regulator SMI1